MRDFAWRQNRFSRHFRSFAASCYRIALARRCSQPIAPTSC